MQKENFLKPIKGRKTAFLTGGTGFVGSNIACQLLRNGMHLKLLVRNVRNKSGRERISNIFKVLMPEIVDYENQYEVISGDISECNLSIGNHQLRKLQDKIDEVWHCAAALSFEKNKAEETERTNIDGTKNVLVFARKIGARKVHFISTAYVCGNRTEKVFENELECGQEFKNPYEKSKFKAEQLIKEYEKDYKLQSTIYRPSVIIGDSRIGLTISYMGYYYLARFFYILKKMLLKELKNNPNVFSAAGIFLEGDKLNLPIRFPGSLKSTLNLINIDYVADLITTIAMFEESTGKVFHIVNPKPPTCELVCEASLDILGIKGYRLVSLAEFQKSKPLNELIANIEADIFKNSEMYIPYILGEPEFDNSNVKALLGSSYKSPPFVTRELLDTILSFAIKSNFRGI